MHLRKRLRSEVTRDITSGLSVSEQVEAKLQRPLSSSGMTESCRTSVYISKFGISGWTPSAARTELAMSPTPDCKGRNDGGIRPARISATRNSATFWPIFSVSGVGWEKALVSSLSSVWTTPAILDGLMITIGEPMRSAQLKMGISWRAGGSFGSKMSCMPSNVGGWIELSSMSTFSASRR